MTRTPLPVITASTSLALTIDVSPGVVIGGAPCAAGEFDGILGEHRLMCSMKCSDSEMHDAGPKSGAIVVRPRDAAQDISDRCRVQASNHSL
jgi:hypothetical protein